MANDEPRHLVAAARATKMLEYYGVTSPHEIRLDDIAWDQGIEIAYCPLKGAAAHLVRIGKSGTITVNSRIEEEGSRRFAIGHELGHWAMHQEVSQLFLCTTDNLRDYENSPIEFEANTFASEILMPRSLVPKRLWEADTTLWQPQQIAADFGVSLTAAAIRWVRISGEPAMVVFSDGERVGWWRRNPYKCDGLWLESRQPLSADSLAHAIATDEHGGTTTLQVPWDVWFPHISKRSEFVVETSAQLGKYNTVISMLWMPELEDCVIAES